MEVSEVKAVYGSETYVAFGSLFLNGVCRNRELYDITNRNIRLCMPEGMKKPEIKMISVDESKPFENIVFDGLFINGERQTDLSRFNLNIKNCREIKLI